MSKEITTNYKLKKNLAYTANHKIQKKYYNIYIYFPRYLTSNFSIASLYEDNFVT